MYLSWVTLKRHLSIGVVIVYIDTGSSVPNIPAKLRGLADENKKFLTEWKWFETSVLNNPSQEISLLITILNLLFPTGFVQRFCVIQYKGQLLPVWNVAINLVIID